MELSGLHRCSNNHDIHEGHEYPSEYVFAQMKHLSSVAFVGDQCMSEVGYWSFPDTLGASVARLGGFFIFVCVHCYILPELFSTKQQVQEFNLFNILG